MKLDNFILGDSIEIIKNFPDNFFHAIISDIPYGIGCDDWDILHNNKNSAYGGTSPAQISGGGLFKRRGKPLNGWSEADKQIPLEYQKWCSSWADNWLRILKPGGTCFIFAGRRYAHRCIIALEDSGFTFKDMLAWEKISAPHRAQRLSEIYRRRNDLYNAQKWKGWRVANLRPLFEPVLWFQKPYKTGGTIADNVINYDIGAWNEQALQKYNSHDENFSNIISVMTESSDKNLHPAQKPLNLMKLLISLVTKEGQIILDPFMGSGTTCLAAKILHRHYIGIEINHENIKIAESRLNNSEQYEIEI
ncbi:MAG: site-specific DNA-methyltransferase [Synergistaceae bacterium]|nr:site-specific DNA-methyltransferase [Synergistaceae bacterium]